MTLTVEEAAARIRAGGLVAFPTETVYGLGANALDAAAVAKIFEIKSRPATSPLIVHVSSLDMARQVAAEWPPLASELAAKWWPGPLTIVVRKNPAVPDIVTAGLNTVGIRMPSHPVALELIRTAGVPLAAPSANRFTGLSPTTAEHVRKALGDEIGVIEGGASNIGIESTVVAVNGDKLVLLRPGMISLGEIEQATPQHDAPHPSPGLHERHYSPKTRLILIANAGELPGREGAYLWRRSSGISSRSVRMPLDARSYAARLYSVLHELDAENWPWIAVERPPERPEWAAVLDRLRRAAGK